MTFQEALRILREERVLLIAIVVLTIIGAVAAGRIMPPDTSATAQVRVFQDDRSAALLSITGTPATVDHDVLMDTQIRLMTSPVIATRVIERLGLSGTSNDLLQRVSVTALGRSTVLSVKAEAPDSASAVTLVDTWVSEYLAWYGENTRAELAAATSTLGTRTAAAKQRVTEAEARIKAGGHTKEADTALSAAATDYEQLLLAADRLQTLSSLDTAPVSVVSAAIAEDRSTVVAIVMDALKGLAVGLVLGILVALVRRRPRPATQPN